MPLMISCRELDDFLVDYLEDRLPERQRHKFEWHLRLCSDCRRYMEAYKQTIALSRAAFSEPDAPVPEDVPEDLVKTILALREKHS
jgi:anti-sigma factor RsiW